MKQVEGFPPFAKREDLLKPLMGNTRDNIHVTFFIY